MNETMTETEMGERIAELEEALAFYADPDTYYAIGFFPDPPCGEFMDDFSDTGYLGMKPGARARAVLYGDKATGGDKKDDD